MPQRVQAVAVVVDSLFALNSEQQKGEGWSGLLMDREMSVYASTSKGYRAFSTASEKGLKMLEETPEAGQPETSPRKADRDPNAERGELKLLVKIYQKSSGSNMAIKFKLANTIFQTGQPTTAIYHGYHVQRGRDGAPNKFISNRHIKLVNATVETHKSVRFRASLDWPLAMLTVPRKIKSSNGNIIKEILAGNAAGQRVTPASQELEVAIKHWLELHPVYDPSMLEQYPLEIYAGIVQHPGTTPPPPADINKLKANYRFVKVVSGGGGWGGNGGMVALDPDGMGGFNIPGGEKLQEVTKATSIIGPDTWVQFFHAIRPSFRELPAYTLGRFAVQVVDRRDDMPKETWKSHRRPSGAEDAVSENDPSGKQELPKPAVEDAAPETPSESDSQNISPPQSPSEGQREIKQGGLATEVGVWVGSRKMDVSRGSLFLDILEGATVVTERGPDIMPAEDDIPITEEHMKVICKYLKSQSLFKEGVTTSNLYKSFNLWKQGENQRARFWASPHAIYRVQAKDSGKRALQNDPKEDSK
ncbi:hypothetical protein DRE_07459 [Drechslerella stenobrocha 248]|uniref:Uncharacterized protein n=1 Tax=Drechslerella stenobrocha 248 TaxID=1043628 RepID=W7HUG5_9PEZI|nr:hypothetical protein DRE_07459 [Drechslerella stenobrocha 248]